MSASAMCADRAVHDRSSAVLEREIRSWRVAWVRSPAPVGPLVLAPAAAGVPTQPDDRAPVGLPHGL